MLKKRIIPIQLLLNERLVKTVQFGNYRDVGDPVASSRVYNSQYADELIFLNIDREAHSIKPLTTILEKVSKVCFMPLSLGGGIRTIDDAVCLIRSGADKVILNSICYTHLNVISDVARLFGRQAVIVAIDAKWDKISKKYSLFSHCGRKCESISLDEHLACCAAAGAGEFFIQSIDQDGMMQGFDVELVKSVVNQSNAPVIAAGGSGNYEHMKDVFLQTRVSAVACGSIFNFSDSNLMRAKAFLSNYDLAFKLV